MQEFVYNNFTLCIALPTIVISIIITIYTSYLSYKKDKQIFYSVENMSFWEYMIDWDYIYLRWILIFILTAGALLCIEGAMYITYEDTLIEQHKSGPCRQCQYRKYENTWYDKRGIEHKETQLIWQRCPALK